VGAHERRPDAIYSPHDLNPRQGILTKWAPTRGAPTQSIHARRATTTPCGRRSSRPQRAGPSAPGDGVGTATQRMPAAWAACTLLGESSRARAYSAATPGRAPARRSRSGSASARAPGWATVAAASTQQRCWRAALRRSPTGCGPTRPRACATSSVAWSRLPWRPSAGWRRRSNPCARRAAYAIDPLAAATHKQGDTDDAVALSSDAYFFTPMTIRSFPRGWSGRRRWR